MNTITLARCHLANDKSASYRDICVDGEVLQAVLKREFPHVFSLGRYKETFMPIIDVNAGGIIENARVGGKSKTIFYRYSPWGTIVGNHGRVSALADFSGSLKSPNLKCKPQRS